MWQQFYQEHRDDGFEVLAVAMDGQGADRARPYVEGAGATYTAVVDAEAVTGQLYGFKTVGNGFFIDEDGTLIYKKLNGFDIRRPQVRKMAEEWVGTSELNSFEEQHPSPRGPAELKADEIYKKGLARYREGDNEGALALWREALQHDPDSIIIHRHIWAVGNPERFYDGDIDQAWKKEQLSKGL